MAIKIELPMLFKNDAGETTAIFDGATFMYRHPYYEKKWITIKKLVRNRLLVRMDVKSKKTPSGLLWLPSKKIQSSQVGTVLMKTPTYWDFFSEKWCSTDDFGIGSRVLFRPTAGMPLYYSSSFTVWFFQPGSIMAFIENEENVPTHAMPITPFMYEETQYPEGGDDDVDE